MPHHRVNIRIPKEKNATILGNKKQNPTGQRPNPAASCPASGALGGIIGVPMDLGIPTFLVRLFTSCVISLGLTLLSARHFFFQWMSHSSGTSSILGPPLQPQPHLHSFEHSPLKSSMQGLWSCIYNAWPQQLFGPLVQASMTLPLHPHESCMPVKQAIMGMMSSSAVSPRCILVPLDHSYSSLWKLNLRKCFPSLLFSSRAPRRQFLF